VSAARLAGAVLAGSLVLTGCGGGEETGASSGSGTVKFDQFCTIDGLAPSPRHSTIVIDTAAIRAASPEQFRTSNPELFKLVMGVANPTVALESGASAARERVTILAASSRGGTLTPVFSGCIPGVSAAELAARSRSGSDSAADRYFGSDLPAQVTKHQEAFTRQLLLVLAKLGDSAEPTAAAADGQAPLVRLLRPLGSSQPTGGTVQRLFIFSDLAPTLEGVPLDVTEARKKGFADAGRAALRLGLADAYLIGTRGALQDAEQQYLDAFMLGSQARLGHAGGYSTNSLAPPPSSVVTYRGSLVLDATSFPLELRVATTSGGDLVNSWVTYTSSHGQRSTPIAGRFDCAAPADCTLQSDRAGGLGQLWGTRPGPEPELLPEGPLGGLRFLDARETAGGLKGRVHDPAIGLGRPGGGLTIEARRVKT